MKKSKRCVKVRPAKDGAKKVWQIRLVDGPCAQTVLELEGKRPPLRYSIPILGLRIAGHSVWAGADYAVAPPSGPGPIPYRLENISLPPPPEGFPCPWCGQMVPAKKGRRAR
jgi:hypothetical protein